MYYLPIIWFFLSITLLEFTIENVHAQEILLESTIVRCSHDEMLEDGTPKNPLQLASSFKGHPKLNLKFYSKCRKKLLITLRVTESAENFVPNALILIDKAKNILTHKSSRFGLPIAVKFHQEILLQRYGLKYLYRVNGKMWEEVINYENKQNYTGCIESDASGPPTCGYVPGSASKQIAGFCCSCQDHRNHIQQRGGQRCDVPGKTQEQLTSAHCLRSSPFWYNVYEILPPSLYQKLTFEIFKSREYSNGSIFWEKMSGNENGVQVDSDAPMNAAGAMKVTYRPHVEGIGKAIMLFNSSGQRLLFPLPYPFGSDQFPDPEPLKGPIEDQMLIVPKSMMSPHGATCDHVGTQIDAFLNQQESCRQERNSCLKNQPFDLWKQDQGPRGDPNFKFRLSSYQTKHLPLVDFAEDYKSGSIYVEHKADAPTYVDIEIPADDIVILAPGYNAFIESVLTISGSEGAKVVTQVINKELVEAAFNIELVQCNLNFSQWDEISLTDLEMKSKRKKIGPLNAKYFYLDLHSHDFKLPVNCYVVLVNEYGESIAAREVTLKPYETCLCVHTCKCACGENTNLRCEKMSDESIIAAGLISAVKTAVQKDAQEQSQFMQKYRWIFHWILVFHIVLLIFALIGWLQKQWREPKRKKRNTPYHPDDDDTSSTSGNSDTSEVLFDRSSPSNSQILEEVFNTELTTNIVSSKDISSQLTGMTVNSNGSGATIKTNVSGETKSQGLSSPKLSTSSSRKESGSANKVKFASEPQFQESPYSASSIDIIKARPSHFDSVSTSKVASIESHRPRATQRSRQGDNVKPQDSADLALLQAANADEATPTKDSVRSDAPSKSMRSKKSSKRSRRTKGSEKTVDGSILPAVTEMSIPGQRGVSSPSAGPTDAPDDLQQPETDDDKAPRSPVSSSRSTVKSEQGPQTIGSSNLWINNGDTNHNSIEDFVNYCVSASSSKTSFGTWHRRRRDQYSAYDFLPEPKH